MNDSTANSHRIYASDRRRVMTEVAVEPGQSLMQALQGEGLVDGTCGGGMACGTCAIRIASPWSDALAPQADGERQLLEGLGLDDEGCRLACQIPYTAALAGMLVEVVQGHD